MGRERSPNYPAIGLGAAVEAIKALYAKEKRTSVPGVIAAKALGYKGLSGPARVKLAALKKYGLIEGNEKTGMRVSDLGLHILFPSGGDDEDESRRKAALSPELFRALYDNYRDASDEALKSYLVTRLQFASNGATQAIAAFRDTITFANLGNADYNASGMSDRSEASSTRTLGSFPPPPDPGDLVKSRRNVSAQVFSWPLSKDVTAEVRFAGGAVTPEQIDRLTKYLELVKDALETTTDA